jgi:hypothetical protein
MSGSWRNRRWVRYRCCTVFSTNPVNRPDIPVFQQAKAEYAKLQ